MSRYRMYGVRDDQPTPAGDRVFVGVDMRVAPDRLPEGLAAKAVNKRFTRGEAQTRPALFELTPQSVPGPVLGAELFSNPNGYEGILIATPTAVWLVRDGTPPQEIGLGDVVLQGDVALRQAFDRVILLRGREENPLEWNGSSGNGFGPVEQSDSGTGTDPIPPSVDAAHMANRLFLPYPTGDRLDGVLVSDALDYTRYVPLLAQFRVNFGTSDDIRRLLPYGQSILLVMKERSLAYLRNVYGDMSDVVAAEITREVGLMAPYAVVQLGAAVWFLGRGGVYRFVPGDQDKLELEAATLSAAMQPFFATVNWRAANDAILAADEERIYVVVPYGPTTTDNNAMAIYNHVTERWEGYHLYPEGTDCVRLIETTYLGRRRLWWIDRSGRVGVLGIDLAEDWWGGSHLPIADELVTRGYHSGAERKRFSRVSVGLATWAANVTIEALPDGPSEVVTLAQDLEGSRTAYRVLRPAYELDNSNDDHDLPYREDYAVQVGDEIEPQSGVTLELHAEQLWRQRVRARGNSLQVRIASAGGSCTVQRVAVEAEETDRATRSYS